MDIDYISTKLYQYYNSRISKSFIEYERSKVNKLKKQVNQRQKLSDFLMSTEIRLPQLFVQYSLVGYSRYRHLNKYFMNLGT